MRYGHVFDPSQDKLFHVAGVTAGGVLLSRSTWDNYCRLRVFDSDCNAINSTLEPSRWVVSGSPQAVDGAWRYRAGDSIELSYNCYPAAFTLEFDYRWIDPDGNLPACAPAGVIHDGTEIAELYLTNGTQSITIKSYEFENPGCSGFYAFLYVNDSYWTTISKDEWKTIRITRDVSNVVSVEIPGYAATQLGLSLNGQVKFGCRAFAGSHALAYEIDNISTVSGAPSGYSYSTLTELSFTDAKRVFVKVDEVSAPYTVEINTGTGWTAAALDGDDYFTIPTAGTSLQARIHVSADGATILDRITYESRFAGNGVMDTFVYRVSDYAIPAVIVSITANYHHPTLGVLLEPNLLPLALLGGTLLQRWQDGTQYRVAWEHTYTEYTPPRVVSVICIAQI